MPFSKISQFSFKPPRSSTLALTENLILQSPPANHSIDHRLLKTNLRTHIQDERHQSAQSDPQASGFDGNPPNWPPKYADGRKNKVDACVAWSRPHMFPLRSWSKRRRNVPGPEDRKQTERETKHYPRRRRRQSGETEDRQIYNFGFIFNLLFSLA